MAVWLTRSTFCFEGLFFKTLVSDHVIVALQAFAEIAAACCDDGANLQLPCSSIIDASYLG